MADELRGRRAYSASEKRAVIERIYAAWLAVPEQRLGQLLWNCSGAKDIFYSEDTRLAGDAEEYAMHHGRNPA